MKVKTKPGVEGERRVEGTITAADDDAVTVHDADGAERTLRYDDIERARTVFEWGGAAKPRQEEGQELMSNIDFGEALAALAQDKGISVDTLLGALADALESAYKRMPGAHEYAWVTIDPDTFDIRVFAQEIDEDGEPYGPEIDVTPDDFGRIAAMTARQVMTQRIREAERELKYEEYAGREGDIVTGIIQQTDSRYTLLDLGRVEALLPQAEQVPYERPDAQHPAQGVHRRGAPHRQGPADRRVPHPPGPHPRAVQARGARDRRRHRRAQGLRPRARPPHEDRRLVERLTTSTRSAPASAPAAPASAWSSTSSTARRSTSSRSPTTRTTS